MQLYENLLAEKQTALIYLPEKGKDLRRNNLRSDKRVMKYLDRPLAKTIADANELVKKITDSLNNNDGITWAITLKNNPAFFISVEFFPNK